MVYFYTDGNKKYGPFSKQELIQLRLDKDTMVWRKGLTDWTKVLELQELNGFIEEELSGKSVVRDLNDSKQFKEKKTKANNIDKYAKRVFVGVLLFVFIVFMVNYLMREFSHDRVIESVVNSSWAGQEDFDVYVDKFYRDINAYGIYPVRPEKIVVRFSPLARYSETSHIHGLSFGRDKTDLIEIYINPESWKNFNRPMKHLLMYHELAHDVLDLPDLEATEENKGRLMYPEISGYEFNHMD